MDAAPTIPPVNIESRPPRTGDTCPQCGSGRLDYNGVLLLACDACGYALGEGGGCT
jgi:uncharacterized protein (DUF983 family)